MCSLLKSFLVSKSVNRGGCLIAFQEISKRIISRSDGGEAYSPFYPPKRLGMWWGVSCVCMSDIAYPCIGISYRESILLRINYVSWRLCVSEGRTVLLSVNIYFESRRLWLRVSGSRIFRVF